MDVDKLRQAEKRVADLQEALSAVETGLQRMESAAVAAETMRTRSEKMMRLAVGLVGVSILLVLLSLRRGRSET